MFLELTDTKVGGLGTFLLNTDEISHIIEDANDAVVVCLKHTQDTIAVSQTMAQVFDQQDSDNRHLGMIKVVNSATSLTEIWFKKDLLMIIEKAGGGSTLVHKTRKNNIDTALTLANILDYQGATAANTNKDLGLVLATLKSNNKQVLFIDDNIRSIVASGSDSIINMVGTSSHLVDETVTALRDKMPT